MQPSCSNHTEEEYSLEDIINLVNVQSKNPTINANPNPSPNLIANTNSNTKYLPPLVPHLDSKKSIGNPIKTLVFKPWSG